MRIKTLGFWWRHFIWHPLDLADRVLVLVGAVAAYTQKGDDAVLTQDLAWQIPLGVVLTLLVWRIMELPVRIIEDIKRERTGVLSVTIESISEQVKQLTSVVVGIERGGRTGTQIDADTIIPKIVITHVDADYTEIAMQQRRVVFQFSLHNYSEYAIRLQDRTTGFINWSGSQNIVNPSWILDMKGVLIPNGVRQ